MLLLYKDLVLLVPCRRITWVTLTMNLFYVTTLWKVTALTQLILLVACFLFHRCWVQQHGIFVLWLFTDASVNTILWIVPLRQLFILTAVVFIHSPHPRRCLGNALFLNYLCFSNGTLCDIIAFTPILGESQLVLKANQRGRIRQQFSYRIRQQALSLVMVVIIGILGWLGCKQQPLLDLRWKPVNLLLKLSYPLLSELNMPI